MASSFAGIIRNAVSPWSSVFLHGAGALILLASLQPVASGRTPSQEPGAAGSPYPNMPRIASPGVQIGKYLPLPASTQAPTVDPAKGYRTEKLGAGVYLVKDNMYQSMFLVYESGVVVIDAPPSFSEHIPQAIAEVTDRPITHIVYSHSHNDHIGGAGRFHGNPTIIAQEETKTLLQHADDPNRPLPTVTFKDQYTLKVGTQILELSYHGYGHAPGNIYIYAPAQKVLMVVDVVSPGWIPYRGLSLSRKCSRPVPAARRDQRHSVRDSCRWPREPGPARTQMS